ncbi:SusC/RagA family TonB-linked outer membrane protein [Prolixibacteraceae bacterium JC049]|nr:SusC/RagA family TonB-linked outer membrane protein [Prolixibacteraceae bacterium JC049]
MKKLVKWRLLQSEEMRKTILVMRLTCIFMLLGLLKLSASGFAQHAKLNMNLKNATLQQVFTNIEEQSDYVFFYKIDQVELKRNVDYRCENREINQILNDLFIDSNLTYKVVDNHIVLFSKATNSGQQNKKVVVGKVTDKSGESLPGVSVVIKGTTIGITTDIDGKYSLTIPANANVLQFSFVGMKTQEVKIDGQTSINIVLTEDAIGIEEVVAVGYGVQKKATLTGSIETVSSDVFEDKAVTNPALALQGQSPGLVVTRSSSRPGRESLNFQIRGATSVNGGKPLIVIDGTPAINSETFYNMNPDDIQSISVLKDGSASIYGSRAANGVILVTTKKGKGKMKIELSSNLRINSIGIRPPTPSMQDYATVWLEAAEQDGVNANYWGWKSKENLQRMQAGEEGIYNTLYWGDIFIGNYPRFDELYGTSASNQHNVSISGSSQKSSYRISAGYAENVGSLQTAYDGKEQYNIRFNYDYDFTNWLKLETGVSYFSSHISSPSGGLGTTSGAYDPPFFPAKNPYGQWYANFNVAGNRNAIANTVDGGRENKKRDQIKLTFTTTLNLTKELSLKGTASFEKDFYDYQRYHINVPQYTWFGELSPESVNPNPSIRESKNTSFYKNLGGFLNYNKSIKDHTFSAMIGVTAELSTNKNLYGYRKGFEDFGVYDLNLGSQELLVEAKGGQSNWGLYSYVGRFNYNYKNRYLLELTGRRDGSSKFHHNYRYSNFGGFSLGWVITEEKFMEKYDFISFLKARGSYGEVGNQVGIGNHDYLSTMKFGTAVFGDAPAYQSTARINGLTSNQRSWERVEIASYGIDFRLLENKLYGSFDFFTKKNNGMLVKVNYPDLLGGDAPKSNSGVLETHGWEFSIGYKGKVGEVSYNISANLSDSENELIKMEGADSWKAGKVKTRQGYPINSWFMYKTNGYFENEDAVNAYYNNYTENNQGEVPSGTSSSERLRPGDTRKVDVDGNGYISAIGNGSTDTGDVVFMGDAAPHYNFGINMGLQFRNFDFSAFFQGVLKQKIQRGGYMNYPFSRIWTNQTTAYIGKTWTESNTGAEFPRMTANGRRASWNYANNDFMLQNNRYIRLKSLVIGYTLKDLQIAKYKLDKFRIFFSGNDLFEFTSIKDGFDPEFGESSNNSYPFTRTWSLGVNVAF